MLGKALSDRDHLQNPQSVHEVLETATSALISLAQGLQLSLAEGRLHAIMRKMSFAIQFITLFFTNNRSKDNPAFYIYC